MYRFLKDYGAKLGGIMLYGGNSYVHPNDDAPRVIDVLSAFQAPPNFDSFRTSDLVHGPGSCGSYRLP